MNIKVDFYHWDHHYSNGDDESIQTLKDFDYGMHTYPWLVYSIHHRLYKTNMHIDDVKNIMMNLSIVNEMALATSRSEYIELEVIHNRWLTK